MLTAQPIPEATFVLMEEYKDIIVVVMEVTSQAMAECMLRTPVATTPT